VQLNAEYPGFGRLGIEQIVGDGDQAADRCHVTTEVGGQLQHFEVATFVTTRDGLVSEMTEVWAGVDQTPPGGTRPESE
jgi:hypothetical protein